jgi:hypothetical protein
MLVCSSFVHGAHETSGAARIRHSLRPLIFSGANEIENSGRIPPREREVVSAV